MQNFDFALQVMVIGFLVVVVTLVGLFGVLLLFTRIFYKSEVVEPPVPAAEESSPQETAGDDGDQRRTAAIMAAVYRYMQDQGGLTAGRRYSIAVQKATAGNAGHWHILGRMALLNNRTALENIRRKKKSENI